MDGSIILVIIVVAAIAVAVVVGVTTPGRPDRTRGSADAYLYTSGTPGAGGTSDNDCGPGHGGDSGGGGGGDCGGGGGGE